MPHTYHVLGMNPSPKTCEEIKTDVDAVAADHPRSTAHRVNCNEQQKRARAEFEFTDRATAEAELPLIDQDLVDRGNELLESGHA